MKRILAIVFLLAACSTDNPEKFDNPCKPDPEAQECKDIQP